jgi:hypothetical protein
MNRRTFLFTSLAVAASAGFSREAAAEDVVNVYQSPS